MVLGKGGVWFQGVKVSWFISSVCAEEKRSLESNLSSPHKRAKL